MLLFFVLFGVAGLLIFHNFPVLMYMFGWYTVINLCLFIEERIESK